MANAKTLQEQAEEVLRNAEAKGTETNFFFLTTFKRYQVQMRTMAELEKAINDIGPTIKKEYVKGRENVCINPAISEYNKTATAANNTVATLIKIVDAFGDDGEEGSEELMAFITGRSHELS